MTTVVIADDHKMFREGLRSLLAVDSGYDVVGEAETGRQAVELVKQLRPRIVIMDIGMPDLNGIEATRQICREKKDSDVVALSVHTDSRFVGQMLEAGASGYVVKDSAFEELERAMNVVLAGRTYLSPQVAHVVVSDFLDSHTGEVHIKRPSLSEREREVLQLLTEGHSAKEIAGHLNVSSKTIETHRKRIMDKLNIHNLADLTKYAVREGFTSLDS